MAVPPVARITSVLGERMNSSISGRVGLSTTWMMASGAPASSAARASMLAASMQHSRAAGCGEITTALRVISAHSALKLTVAMGLVEGISAKMTPAGRGSSMIFFAASMRGLTKSQSR